MLLKVINRKPRQEQMEFCKHHDFSRGMDFYN
jgi:hypothetical protein